MSNSQNNEEDYSDPDMPDLESMPETHTSKIKQLKPIQKKPTQEKEKLDNESFAEKLTDLLSNVQKYQPEQIIKQEQNGDLTAEKTKELLDCLLQNQLDPIIEEPEYEEEGDVQDLDEQGDVDLMNVFMCYYKKLFAKTGEHMFSNVNYDEIDSTNRCMELFYEEMFKCQRHPEEEYYEICDAGDLDIAEVEELYTLEIDGVQQKECRGLLPLLKYVATLDWLNINWAVIPLRTDDDEYEIDDEDDNSYN